MSDACAAEQPSLIQCTEGLLRSPFQLRGTEPGSRYSIIAPIREFRSMGFVFEGLSIHLKTLHVFLASLCLCAISSKVTMQSYVLVGTFSTNTGTLYLYFEEMRLVRRL